MRLNVKFSSNLICPIIIAKLFLLTVEIKAGLSLETSGTTDQRTPEDLHLQQHGCETLTSGSASNNNRQ
jgi:hypothetical protein